MSKSGKNLQKIFDLEIERLTDMAVHGSLELDDIKKLEVLTRAYRTYNTTTPKDAEEPEEIDLTKEELIALAKPNLGDS